MRFVVRHCNHPSGLLRQLRRSHCLTRKSLRRAWGKTMNGRRQKFHLLMSSLWTHPTQICC
jgi:hypothetical protein